MPFTIAGNEVGPQRVCAAPQCPDEDFVAAQVVHELKRARKLFPVPQHSAHEGYAVLAEELDEVWDIVKQNQKTRDNVALRKELIQVAAMALRMVIEICDTNNRI